MRVGIRLALVMVLVLGGSVWACSVPVFRYALERWRPDGYEVAVFSKGGVGGEQKRVVEALSKGAGGLANVGVAEIDAGGTMDRDAAELLQAGGDVKLPWAAVLYPNGKRAWSGGLETLDVAGLLDSPARRELAKRLIGGESIVWVFLETGDAGKDNAAVGALEKRLKGLEKTIQLPEVLTDDPAIQGPSLRSALPLRVAFSVVRVSRKDPAEAMFVRMVMHEPTLRRPVGEDEVAVCPVFGRGRLLCTLVGQELEGVEVEEAARFLCAACSCQVKELNPGVDLLMAADWESVLEDRGARVPVVEKVVVPEPVIAAGVGPTTRSMNVCPTFPRRSTAMLEVATVGMGLAACMVGYIFWKSKRGA